jgi:anti-anti-sigma factor
MDNPSRTGPQPRLRVRTIGRTAMVRFEDAEILNDEEAIRGIGEQLDRLIKDECHTRLLVNLGGVRYLSTAVLAKLAWAARQVEPVHGQIQVCSFDPPLRDMIRITHLDWVFDVCSDEAEELGLVVR